jgi:hypothetical protein
LAVGDLFAPVLAGGPVVGEEFVYETGGNHGDSAEASVAGVVDGEGVEPARVEEAFMLALAEVPAPALATGIPKLRTFELDLGPNGEEIHAVERYRVVGRFQ